LRGPDPSLLNEYKMGILSHKSRMVINLPPTSDELWDNFKSKLRSQIKRPQKDGLHFTIGNSGLVDDFYRVFAVNMHDIGSPVHSRKWIDAVVRFFGERAHVGIVYTGAKPVAGGIILEVNDIVARPWASALNDYSRSSPNMLLYWGLLAYACDHGFKRFDFGRSTPGEGTYRFKEQWGAAPFTLYWYKQGISDHREMNDATGILRPLVEKAWARLPQRYTDIIGPMVRKYISL
jgi:lipid II:glycine glycyltransferase (peptidoglycan interpeptide bridge formation enzyme)